MNERRNFLKALLGASMALVVIPKLPVLAPTETINATWMEIPETIEGIYTGRSEIVMMELGRVYNDMPKLFERDNTFFSVINRGDIQKITSKDMRVPLQIKPEFRY